MTDDEFFKIREQFDNECRLVLKSKGKDYSDGFDRLSNFKRIASELQLSVLQIAAVYMSKHWDAVLSFIRTGDVYSEPIKSRFIDLRNYIDLIIALFSEVKSIRLKEFKDAN